MVQINKEVHEMLLVYGLTEKQATDAASRFDNVERAVEWVFSEAAAQPGPSSTRASPSSSPIRSNPLQLPEEPTNAQAQYTNVNIVGGVEAINQGWNAAMGGGGPTSSNLGPGLDIGYGNDNTSVTTSHVENIEPTYDPADLSEEDQLKFAIAMSEGGVSPQDVIRKMKGLKASDSVNAVSPERGGVKIGSNNPFLDAMADKSTLPTSISGSQPTLKLRPAPILAKDLPPHIPQSQGPSAWGLPPKQPQVSFGKVSDDLMEDGSRMMVSLDGGSGDVEMDGGEEDRARRGRSPTPAAAKRLRTNSPTPSHTPNHNPTPQSLMEGIAGLRPMGDNEITRSLAAATQQANQGRVLTAQEREDQQMQEVFRLSMQTFAEEAKRKGEPALIDVGSTATMVDVVDLTGSGSATPMDIDADELKAISVDEREDEELIPEKEDGSPVVVVSTDPNIIYAAHILQILYNVPPFATTISDLPLDSAATDSIDIKRIAFIQELFKKLQTSQKAFTDVGKGIAKRFPVMGVRGGVMWEHAHEFLSAVMDSWYATAEELQTDELEPSLIEMDDSQTRIQRLLQHPRSLFLSTARLAEIPDNVKTESKAILGLSRYTASKSILELLGMSVNLGGNNSMAIESLADVFCLTVSKQAEWNPNAIAGLIHLDEAIYMDRFLACNRERAKGIRESETLIKTELENVEKEIFKLTWADVPVKGAGTKRVLIDEMIRGAMDHFGGGHALRNCPEEVAKADSIIEKLRTDRERLANAVKSKKEKKDTLERALLSAWEDVELRKHQYLLRGVLFHAGFSGQEAFASYWRDIHGEWWRSQGFQVVKTDIEKMNQDTMGLYLDAGPYLLIYARAGDRPSEQEIPYPPEPPKPAKRNPPAVGASDAGASSPAQNMPQSPPPDLLGAGESDEKLLQDPMMAEAGGATNGTIATTSLATDELAMEATTRDGADLTNTAAEAGEQQEPLAGKEGT